MDSLEDLAFADATELALLLRTREISPVELVELFIRRIDAANDLLRAFVTVDDDGALRAARAAEQRLSQGGALPRFLGVPVGIKDVVETAGVRTTYSSRQFSNYIPDQDDASWRRMKEAGVILLGKTNTPEL